MFCGLVVLLFCGLVVLLFCGLVVCRIRIHSDYQHDHKTDFYVLIFELVLSSRQLPPSCL